MQLGIKQAGVSLPYIKDFKADKQVDIFKSMQQLGLFGGSNNMNSYYPNATMEDIMPKPEDFMDFPFRLISATIVGAGSWKATDFSRPGVLEASKDMLLAKPVYPDHETDMANWLGIIKSVKWSPETTQDGMKIPGGIDGMISIDAKSNPKVARGVVMGITFSNSVTVAFSWEPSHTFENMREFDDRLGEIGPDGKMVTRVVTNIEDYFESSLLWLGADPFAKLIGADGKLINIDHSSVQYSKADTHSKSLYEKDKKYSISCGFDENVLALSKRKESLNPKNNNVMDKILAQLAIMLGVDVATLTVDSLTKLQLVNASAESVNLINAAIVTELTKSVETYATENAVAKPADLKVFLGEAKFVAADKLVTLTAEAGKVTALEAEKTVLTGEVANLKKLEPLAAIGTSFVKMKRDETVRLYKLSQGDKSDEAVVKLINEAAPDALEGLLKQYSSSATHKFSGSCSDCGSDKFNFRSSFAEGSQTENTDNDDDDTLSFDEMHEKYSSSSMHIGRLAEEEKEKK